tara:strand:+ start:933 stop:1991 length:1059 start_codon:yes stop_codon:yes gene_type:complete
MSHKFCKKIDLTFTYKIIFIFIFICFSCKKDDSSYSLNINTVNSGTVDIENGKYASGEIISLTATPSEGFAFIGWHGEGLENPTDENPLSIVMDSNKDITANFLNLNDPDYSGMGIWTDEIYSEIIHFLDLGEEPIESTSSEAWSKIVSAFVKDANRHGVDISYVLDNPIKYGIKDLGGPGAIAVRHCIDNNVEIIFNINGLSRKRNRIKTGDWWYWPKNPSVGFINGDTEDERVYGWLGKTPLANPGGRKYKDVPSILKTVWHELGHDILNLDHNCLSNNIMTSTMGTAFHCDESEIKFNGAYSFYSQEPSISWQKAVKDMFEGVNQYCLDCSNYVADGEDPPNCIGELKL